MASKITGKFEAAANGGREDDDHRCAGEQRRGVDVEQPAREGDDSGVIPKPMSITMLMTRPIIAGSTRRWIHEIATMFAYPIATPISGEDDPHAGSDGSTPTSISDTPHTHDGDQQDPALALEADAAGDDDADRARRAAQAAASRPRPAGPAAKRWSASHGIPTRTGPLRAKLSTSEMSHRHRRARSAST